MGSLIATQGCSDVWAWAADRAHLGVHDPVAVMVCVDVSGS